MAAQHAVQQEAGEQGPLTTEQVLREEAKAIFGADIPVAATGEKLYRELYKLDSVALCLSGGGIRSASFALGIIQALAWHSRTRRNAKASDSQDSLLSEFHYLSTVSGGGYIGSWLSAWVARAGFLVVWNYLTGRPDGPDIEPQAVAWLRAYSNYLTPKLGIMSADAWAAVALFLRNLILNWLIILPVLCAVLLVFKIFASGIIWFSKFDPRTCSGWFAAPIASSAFVAAGCILLILALRFITRNRPSRGPSVADQLAFLRSGLAPSVFSGIFFTAALAWPCTHDAVFQLPLIGWNVSTANIGVVAGIIIYAVGWIVARPSCQSRGDCVEDFAAWIVAGATYGVLMALGIYLYYLVYGPGFWIFTPSEIALLIFGLPWALLSQSIADMMFVGFSNREKNSDLDREWLGRAAGWLLVVGIGWALAMLLVFIGSELAFSAIRTASTVETSPEELAKTASTFKQWANLLIGPIGVISGVLTAFLGASRLSPASGPAKSGAAFSANLVLAIVAPIFAVCLIISVSALLDQFLLGESLLMSSVFNTKVVFDTTPPWPGGLRFWIAALVAAVIGLVASYFVNINRFSLHALYRNRLVRAFLGASHEKDRQPNPFTDLDATDNLRVHELWPPEDEWVETRTKGWQPFHLINIALNIVSTKRLAWQERKAETFTITPLHSGSACGCRIRNANRVYVSRGAFRHSAEYGDPEGVSLGTALAISGAAASPNMGYHSSPTLAFLLTMLNVRLGWWLGNPEKNANIYTSEGPRWALGPLMNEMLGQTTDESNFVYLSDGGHFENLGLYEMVRRRCKYIIVSDAGCDPDFAFEDLGNAIRKIDIDLGIKIAFHGITALKNRAEEDRLDRCCNSPEEERARNERRAGGKDADAPLHAVGTIDYGDGLQGIILYVKAAYHKASVRNVGVRSYAIANPEFPHQSTGDQFFSESQFESYRALGFEIMDSVIRRVLTEKANPTLRDILEGWHSLTTRTGAP